MRRLFRTLCAVALVACSDSRAVTDPAATPRLRSPASRPDTAGASGPSADIGSIPQQISDLVSNRFAKVTLPPDSYSLSSDAVHPDIACQPGLWYGSRCWLMYTPYKNGDSGYENPGVLQAVNDTTWATPASIKNPLVPYPGFGSYNSDPDHAFDPGTGRLTQVYRVVADTFNNIMIMSTADAKTWTTARVAFRERNHDAVSPSLVINADRSANIWYVRTGTDGCNATSSSIVMRTATTTATQRVDQAAWGAAVPVTLSIPNWVVWHIDVTALPEGQGYAALIVAYQKGNSCSNSDLWLATSDDGITWRNFAMPIFWRGMAIARARKMVTWYRGTMEYDSNTDLLHIWPSGLADQSWTIYHTTVKLHELLSTLSLSKASDLKALAATQPTQRAMIQMP
jgi:hypothetical protein